MNIEYIPPKMTTIVYLPNPFKPASRVVKRLQTTGATLANLADAVGVKNLDEIICSVNGHSVDARSEQKTAPGDFVVFAPKIRGGGGGKNIGAIIGAIALIALTGGAGAGALGGLLGSQAGTLGLGLALYLGGSLLMGNQKIPQADIPSYDSSSMKGGQSWNPNTINIRPGGPVPITYGTIGTSGQLIGRRITTRKIDDKQIQFLYLLLAAGEGELDSITDIKVNDTAVASIDNIYYETKLGTNDQTAVSNILTDVAEQQAFNHELPNDVNAGTWITKTQTKVGERIHFEFVYPRGVYWVSPENGAMQAANTFMRLQYREVGAATWTNILFTAAGDPYGQYLNLQRKPFYFKFSLTPADPTKLHEFRAQNYTLKWYADTYGWTAIPSNFAQQINWLSLTATDSKAETYPGTALVALGIPASENLSGSLPKVTWKQTRSKVLVWNPSTKAYTEQDATNIAWMVYDLIHQARKIKNINTGSYEYVVFGEPAANLDYTAFGNWATFCATTISGVARAKGNLLVDAPDTMWKTIQNIAGSGRGYIIQSAGVFTPVWDTIAEMTQIFTAGNVIAGSVRGGFIKLRERATAIEAKFIDEKDGYKSKTILVKSDDFNPADLDNPTQIFYPGITDPDVVYMLAKHQLRKNKYLKRTLSFKAGIDSIVTQIGDVFGFQCDVTSWGVGGRIMGATTTQLVIDQDVTMVPGQTYSALVRDGATDALTRKTVDAVAEEVTTRTLYFTGDPFATAPAVYDIYAFGLTNLETKPFKALDIRRSGDLEAQIKAIEYIEGVYTDSDDFPVIDYTAAGAAINTLTVDADSDTQKLKIAWSIPDNRDYSGCVVFIDGKPMGFFTAEVSDFEVTSTPGGHTVKIVPIDGNGENGTPKEETVTLGEAELADVSGISLSSELVPQSDGTSLIYITGSFTIPTLAQSVLVEIGEGSKPASWTTVQDARVATVRYGPVKPAQAYTLRFTARSNAAVSSSVTSIVTTTGDSEAPNAPSIGASSYLKTVTILISLATVPSDLAGFKVYRNTIDSSVGAEQIGSVSSKDGRASYTDEAPEYGKTYYYFARSFDTWGNLSAYSGSDSALISSINSTDLVDGALNRSELFQAGVVDAAAIGAAAVTAVKTDLAAIDAASGELNANTVNELQLAADAVTEAKIAADAVNTAQINNAALKNPLGAVASWSAKNCTAADIAEIGGVRDVSGNGNHGQAFGGVAVVDTDIGKGFRFAGDNDTINFDATPFRGATAFTVTMWIKTAGLASGMTRNGYWSNQYIPCAAAASDGKMRFVCQNGAGVTAVATDTASHFDDTWHHFAFVANGATIKIFKDSVEVASADCVGITWPIYGIPFYLGRNANNSLYYGKFDCVGARQYNRALTESEIKSLYMFPEDAAFGNITADLVTTGELITRTAQIGEAVITSAQIKELDAGKIQSGYLSGDRIDAGTLAADTIIGGAIVIGSAAGDVNAGTTTVNGDKITASSITSGKIGAGEIKAVNIESGSITTAKLAAGAVTAEKMLIGKAGSALNDDPNFEDISAWTSGATFITTITDGKVGSGVYRYTSGTTTYKFNEKFIPLDRDKSYRFRAWVRTTGSASSATLYIGSYGYEQNKTPISTNLIHTSISATTSWQEHAIIIDGSNFDLNAKFIRPHMRLSFSNSGAIEVQDYRLEEVLPATLIKDGAIITDKLAANAVVAGKINTGAVETDKLAANAVTADKIDAGAITTEKLNVTALKAPAGEVAAWSAKGSTAASIALVDGVKDVSGNGNHGQAFGGVSVVDSEVGKAFSFDGSNDFIQLADDVGYTNVFTANAWFKRNGLPKDGIYHIIFGGAALELDIIETNGAIRGGLSTSTQRYVNNVGGGFADGSFHMLTLTFNGSVLNFYADGAYIGQLTGITGTLTNSFNRTIGRFGTETSYYANGLIAHPRIYNRALTPAEVKTLYMLGTDQESGVITADRVVTGELKSMNYSTTTGSMFDLYAGDLKLGGSSAPRFSFTNSTNTGVFAGFTFNAKDLTAGSGATAIGISTDTAKRAFWAGGTTPSTAPFQIDHDGTGVMGGMAVGSTGMGSPGTENSGSKYSVIGVFTSAHDTTGTIFDTGSSCFLSLSFVAGPTMNSMVRIGATGYYDGSTTDKAHIKIVAESSADYAIDTNGKIQGDCVDISDERLKSDIVPVSTLDKLKSLSVTEWHYDDDKIKIRAYDDEVEAAFREGKPMPIRHLNISEIDYKPKERHIGPMAADFNRLFGVCDGNERGINLSDGIGVALRAIQELADELDELKAENEELREACKLPKKQKKQKPEPVYLTDEEREYIKIAETVNQRLKAIVKPHAEEVMRRLKE